MTNPDEYQRKRELDYAQEIVEGRYEGENVEKWKARAIIIAKAYISLAALVKKERKRHAEGYKSVVELAGNYYDAIKRAEGLEAQLQEIADETEQIIATGGAPSPQAFAYLASLRERYVAQIKALESKGLDKK